MISFFFIQYYLCILDLNKLYMKYFQKSDIFLIGAAFVSFVLSVSLWFYGYKDEGLFVGLWVPSILSFGCYFKQMLNK